MLITDLPTAQALLHHWQERAARAGVPLRAPPPEPTGCCGRGCTGCVWEGWYAAVTDWVQEAELQLGSPV